MKNHDLTLISYLRPNFKKIHFLQSLNLSRFFQAFPWELNFNIYVHQVNGVKLADILFSLMSVCVCVCVRALIFRRKYLENGLRWRVGINYPLIGNSLWQIE